ncbi:alpha/beta fold hydrolase [Vibrio parahaemolyticus]|uniref:alpha/beta fold hydrolase n=1 Tax=Vibrio parahaemolyticus TaxID=670 RepID=UPI00041D52CF|nr:alpha/beta hydrolase [Vibrio parahaemolyticus]EGQ8010965.1 alpha/beta hydrolase [Vibrio parahaemolyticus]EHK2867844.1 alpha/beta hydrolase [Vibrio parahaemolyticus]EJG0670599.1 alpha/beta hydrolase [Vibrio parahaemolyticus]EKB1982617.1 alpha/beta hydrolase [Vibrio parahaemolyticus]ELA9531507.1 alpha/beta hydrolase [Vibrio parahaemolyticus]
MAIFQSSLSPDISINYQCWGKKRRKALFFVHGLDNNLHIWENLATRLSEHHYVVAIDLRGNGKSSWASSSTYTLDDMSNDIDEVIQHLGINSVILAGHSLGGKIALKYLEEHLYKVDRLILLDCSPQLDAKLKQALDGYFSSRSQVFSSPKEYEDELKATHILADESLIREFAKSNLSYRNGAYYINSDPKFSTSMLDDDGPLMSGKVWDYLPSVSCQVLIIRAQMSSILTEKSANDMHQCLQFSTIVNIKNATHSLMLDQPGILHSVVDNFVISY